MQAASDGVETFIYFLGIYMPEYISDRREAAILHDKIIFRRNAENYKNANEQDD